MSPLSNNNASQSETNQISSNSAFKPLMSESRQLIAMSSSAASNEQYTEHNTRKLLAIHERINCFSSACVCVFLFVSNKIYEVEINIFLSSSN